MKKNTPLKWTVILFALNISCELSAQNKMTVTTNNKTGDIFGYNLSGATKNSTESASPSGSVDMFGPMQNIDIEFSKALAIGQPITEVDINIVGTDLKPVETIKLKSVSVIQIKEYTSSFTDGVFQLSSPGGLNRAVNCSYGSMQIHYYNNDTGEKIKAPLNKMEKYEMNTNSSLTGTTGRVYLNLAADVECVVFIYNPGTNKEITGTTKDRSFYLAPGKYDIKVSSVKMEEIDVEKGMDTRIKAGILNVSSPSAWALYDENKKIRITASSGAKKIGLPIGNYQLQMNGSFRPVTINDGETINF